MRVCRGWVCSRGWAGLLVLSWVVLVGVVRVTGEPAEGAGATRYAAWSRGPSADPSFFPIAVWLQSPSKAARYKAAGFNVYVGLWKGPTEAQLAQLRRVGMKVICSLNDVARRHLDDPTIIGWMHGDEPDNAQARAEGGYGPPIAPEKIVADYRAIRTADPSRPVLLNLGQGVAYDNWIGRGVRRNHPEDYPRYIKGCDIVSFDIYPVVHRSPEVAGKLWYVARGVERLVEWSGGRKIVWNCIECTRIQHPTAKPTPRQVRAEVWMSLIHGSQGLIYFVHEWKPRFNESALLDDLPMLGEVTRINARIHALAPVLNGPTRQGVATVESSNPDVPVAVLVKEHGGNLYVFAVAMRAGATRARFRVQGDRPVADIEDLESDREIAITGNTFSDTFDDWQVRLYRVHLAGSRR